jgi:hypothetical protein
MARSIGPRTRLRHLSEFLVMFVALGAASSLWDTLQSLAASKSSSAQSAGAGQTASSPFGLTGSAAPSTPSSPPSGSPGSNQISPQTLSALLDAQSQTGSSNSAASLSPSQALRDLFSTLDGNGDGSVSKQEFENALGAGGTNVASLSASTYNTIEKLIRSGPTFGTVPFSVSA